MASTNEKNRRKKTSREKGCVHVLQDGIGEIRRAAT